MSTWLRILTTFLLAIAEVLYTWAQRLYRLSVTRSAEDQLTDELLEAPTYAQWWRSAVGLDNLPARYDWRMNPIDGLYDYRHLDERRKELRRLRLSDRPVETSNYLRHGLLRNLFNITRFSLYEQTYTSTKESIEAYLEESLDAIRYIATSPTSLTSGGGRWTSQGKLEALADSKSTYGSTALVLQGGSLFGLCHLGVVKALLEHNILPKVIVGTATGALMAALVSIHTSEELPEFLHGEDIDLSAFTEASIKAREKTNEHFGLLEDPPPRSRLYNWFRTFERRSSRLLDKGFLLDPEVLTECVKANVGDLTFEQAFQHTGRVLNIIISSPSEEIPSLMNYLTAPQVLIRSAAMASHITNMARHRDSPIQLLYKDGAGRIRSIETNPRRTKNYKPPSASDGKTPLVRLKQLFNVDHFIISQARPYLAPFAKPSLPYHRKQQTWIWSGVRDPLRLIPFSFTDCLKHSMLLMDIMGWLPDNARRVLSDETVAGDCITLVPEVRMQDWRRLLKNPTREEVDFWIMRGERSVWPSLCALKVRCIIEIALDQAYERLRRPSDAVPPILTGTLRAALTPPAEADLGTLMPLQSKSVDQTLSHDFGSPDRRR